MESELRTYRDRVHLASGRGSRVPNIYNAVHCNARLRAPSSQTFAEERREQLRRGLTDDAVSDVEMGAKLMSAQVHGYRARDGPAYRPSPRFRNL